MFIDYFGEHIGTILTVAFLLCLRFELGSSLVFRIYEFDLRPCLANLDFPSAKKDDRMQERVAFQN